MSGRHVDPTRPVDARPGPRVPRHPVRWPSPEVLAALTRPLSSTCLNKVADSLDDLAARSSSQAGLASFRGAR